MKQVDAIPGNTRSAILAKLDVNRLFDGNVYQLDAGEDYDIDKVKSVLSTLYAEAKKREVRITTRERENSTKLYVQKVGTRNS